MPKEKRLISAYLSGEEVAQFQSVLKYYRDMDGSDSMDVMTRSALVRMLVINEFTRLVREKEIKL